MPLAPQGITRTESDELWQQHAGHVLASLDLAGGEAVLAVLFQLMELRHCRRTIEGKGWWGVTAKLVAWIYGSRMRGMEASDSLKRKRKATAAEVSVGKPCFSPAAEFFPSKVLLLCDWSWPAWQIASLSCCIGCCSIVDGMRGSQPWSA